MLWRAGLLRSREIIAHGLESAPQAFVSMLHGGNVGKQLVQLTEAVPIMKHPIALGAVQETMLITLYGRALEARSGGTLLDDPRIGRDRPVRRNGTTQHLPFHLRSEQLRKRISQPHMNRHCRDSELGPVRQVARFASILDRDDSRHSRKRVRAGAGSARG